MSNMSYCRFQNTDRDLADCQGALEELFNADDGPLSEEELRAAKRLVERCAEIVQLVGEVGGLDVMAGEDDDRFMDKFGAEHILEQANATCRTREEEGRE